MKPMLLKDYFGQDCQGWFASVKLDGIRAIWTGSEYVTREGNALNVPESWLVGMPDHYLDGEIDPNIGNFTRLQAMMRDGWHGLSFAVFDLPGPGTFSQRLKALRRLSLPSHCSLVEHWRIEGPQAVWEQANAICDEGGEGLVIRSPKGVYLSGQRSDDILRMVPQCPSVNRKRVA